MTASTNKVFSFRPLSESDLLMLTKWLNRPHLQKWWRSEKMTTDKARKKYLPRITGKDDAVPFIAEIKEKPAGYIQYYDVSEGDPNWWPDEPGPGTIGIDLFIADANNLNKGLGTKMVSEFTEFLFEDPDINQIRVDPRPNNLRAIHCYEKAGFQSIGPMTNPDGPAVLLVLNRPT